MQPALPCASPLCARARPCHGPGASGLHGWVRHTAKQQPSTGCEPGEGMAWGCYRVCHLHLGFAVAYFAYKSRSLAVPKGGLH